MPPALFFLLTIALAIQSLVDVSFRRTFFFISMNNVTGILIGIALNLDSFKY
jgi:hypothetical protein